MLSPSRQVARQHDDLIIALSAEGKSFREIAISIYGTPDARNKIAGRVHRLKVSQREDVLQARVERKRKAGICRKAISRVRKPPEPLAEMIPPDPQFRCTIMQLTDASCRYPVGDPAKDDFRFCGRPEANFPTRPYCSHCENWVWRGRGPIARALAA